MRFFSRFPAIAAFSVLLACGTSAFAADEAPASPPPSGPGPLATAPASDLDQLFTELKGAANADAAKLVEAAILQRFLRSGSDTVDLLMSWAIDSMNDQNYPLALDILDSVVAMKPDYAEGWNKRATVFYLSDDYGKSLADIRQVLSLQPRHFGALSGLGMIMRDIGQKEKAKAAFRAALDVDPFLENVKKALQDLEKETAGQGI
jgi:tetratricopeptide (TPR) repeat protein